VTSQTAHNKYKWLPYVTEWNTPMKIFCVRHWLDQVCRSRWRLQVSPSQPEPVLILFNIFYQNGSGTYRGPYASADRVNVWGLLCFLKELNQYWNVKWTMKHSLH